MSPIRRKSKSPLSPKTDEQGLVIMSDGAQPLSAAGEYTVHPNLGGVSSSSSSSSSRSSSPAPHQTSESLVSKAIAIKTRFLDAVEEFEASKGIEASPQLREAFATILADRFLRRQLERLDASASDSSFLVRSVIGDVRDTIKDVATGASRAMFESSGQNSAQAKGDDAGQTNHNVQERSTTDSKQDKDSDEECNSSDDDGLDGKAWRLELADIRADLDKFERKKVFPYIDPGDDPWQCLVCTQINATAAIECRVCGRQKDSKAVRIDTKFLRPKDKAFEIGDKREQMRIAAGRALQRGAVTETEESIALQKRLLSGRIDAARREAEHRKAAKFNQALGSLAERVEILTKRTIQGEEDVDSLPRGKLAGNNLEERSTASNSGVGGVEATRLAAGSGEASERTREIPHILELTGPAVNAAFAIQQQNEPKKRGGRGSGPVIVARNEKKPQQLPPVGGKGS